MKIYAFTRIRTLNILLKRQAVEMETQTLTLTFNHKIDILANKVSSILSVADQTRDTDSYRAPGLTSDLNGANECP